MRQQGAAPAGCAAPSLGKRLDDYIAGRLDPSDRDAFELHSFGCKACLDELDLARSIQKSFVAHSSGAGGSKAGAAREARAAGVLATSRRILKYWLRMQRSRGISPAGALLWHLPKRTLAHGVGAGIHAVHDLDLARWHRDEYRAAIRAAFGRSSVPPHVVVVVRDTLHFLIPTLMLATRYVPIVLVINGARRWETRLLTERFPSLPVIHLRTVPGTMMPHGQTLELFLRHAEQDIVLHDPDLYVFNPDVYREMTLEGGEIAAGPFGHRNRESGIMFLTTPLLALRSDAIRELMDRHRIGPELYRRTPARLAPALQTIGIGDHNFPKDYLSYYDPLDLIFAMAIHDGHRLRTFVRSDADVLHIGGISYLEENYRLDYLHRRFLALPTAAAFVERYRSMTEGSLEDLRLRFHAGGAAGALDWIDSLVERVQSAVAE